MAPQHPTPVIRAVLILLTPATFAYPSAIYGSSANRYSHAPRRLRAAYEPPAYPSYQAQPVIGPRYHPLSYYKVYPYSDTYNAQQDDTYYYPQEAGTSYPMYYPRTSKYEVYQAMLPYYYTDTPYGTSYDYDPAAELQEEIQEAEREEREEAQPIGHESFYENDNDNSQDNYAEVNAAFLQNLILSQMYQDQMAKEKQQVYQEKGIPFNGYLDYEDSYSQANDKQSYLESDTTTAASEDEDVKELKQLPKQNKNRQHRKQGKNGNDLHWSQKQGKSNRRKQKEEQPTKRDSNDLDYFQDPYHEAVVFTDRKAAVKTLDTAAGVTSTPEPLLKDFRGQKEEFQMRPATPVRHPFAAPVLTMLSNREETKRRTPSVYDTIKHMLDMEKSLENVSCISEYVKVLAKNGECAW
ncbi:unnamed protein product [Acanthoscelides obtectus]|uniref:Uncharacterized protein n=1 Tax=Acanthoscelides obtectus TaxID=200917 RepID=A0A9P0MNC5_ACAOB|nr:unnamed protein product [Acanthoscelides obtectus]CAK1629494.1 hypothetical protein AOBTE_LOCUS5779 [Acanthoscelides obtectus]